MVSKQIVTLIKKYNGRLFNYNTEGVLILNKSGSNIFHISAEQCYTPNEQTLVQISDFFVNQPNQSLSVSKKYNIFVNFNMLQNIGSISHFSKYLLKILKNHNVHLIFLFKTLPSCWVNTLISFIEERILSCLVDGYHIPIWELSGPFTITSEEDKEKLFRRRVHLVYEHNLTEKLPFISYETKNVVSDFSEYGFRIPFLWYVNKSNLSIIPTIIDEIQYYNRNSGFMFSIDSDVENMPQYEEYLKLLALAYKKYTYYDDILFPLNEFHYRSLFFVPSINFVYNDDEYKLVPIVTNQLEMRATDFFEKLFVWQRYRLVTECSHSIS